MGAIPSSMVAAVACSAAAGKNPWLPLALIFLLAAPGSVPAIMMDPDLHRQLHDLGPEALLWSLGGVFAVLALADSLADKIGFIEKWLVPISTAWRPFAGVAAAALLGVAAVGDTPEAEVVVQQADMGLLVGGSVVAITIALGALSTWIATMGKTGMRLLMTMVPMPGLRLAHSFVDDLFALGASVAGLAFASTPFVAVLVAIYLAIGLFTGPLLTRLTWIHVRIGWSLVRKGLRAMSEDPPLETTRPAWLSRWLAAEGYERTTTLPAYVFGAPGVGRCRAGFLVLAEGRAAFVSRVRFRPRAFVVDDASLSRIGLADTTTERVVILVDRPASGGLRSTHVHLFPAREAEVVRVLEEGASRAGLVRVRPTSESARRGLPGHASRSPRFLPAEQAGSLSVQGTLTIAAAVAVGILTGGVFIPIGAGYLLSPFKVRFAIGLAISAYLSLCIMLSLGLGWPAAVIYASLLNVLALRDLTRNALKARVDGFVDKDAWLPAVASRVWIAKASLVASSDRCEEGAPEPLTDGSWRAVVRLLAEETTAPVADAA